MFSSVLIANRGEIAVRIARTAKRLGLRTIAVYSEADAGRSTCAPATRRFRSAGGAARELPNIDRLIEVARRAGAAMHSSRLRFPVGKCRVRRGRAARQYRLYRPVARRDPRHGAEGSRQGADGEGGRAGGARLSWRPAEPAFLNREAYEIGYPVLVKAVAGGGGRGMRRVDQACRIRRCARRCATRGGLRLRRPAGADREVHRGAAPYRIPGVRRCRRQVIHLNERDCSLQRRHQKVVEEAPAPGMTPALRAELGRPPSRPRAPSAMWARAPSSLSPPPASAEFRRFWFMEMNTRLQVEHPVTEAVTGFDLVDWQFRIAAGEPLAAPGRRALRGHAVEARLYAEDPDRGFLPSPGRILALELPQGEGIRVDPASRRAPVPPDYDPMIAKVIAHAPTRTEALDRLAAALDDTS